MLVHIDIFPVFLIIIVVVPTLTLAGVTIDDLTGQAYRDTSNVFEIEQ